MTQPLVSQLVVELLSDYPPQITQLAVELLSLPIPDARVSQLAAELLTSLNTARVAIQTTTLPDAIGGRPYPPFALVATLGTTPYVFSTVAGFLPIGLTMTSAGVIAGTPPLGPATIAPPTVPPAVVDALYVSPLTVLAPDAVSFFTVRVTDALADQDDQDLSLRVHAWVPPTTWSAVNLPPCLRLLPDGSFAGAPMQVGVFPFTVFATDGVGRSLTLDYVLTVTRAP